MDEKFQMCLHIECEGSDWACSDVMWLQFISVEYVSVVSEHAQMGIHIYRVCEGSGWAWSDMCIHIYRVWGKWLSILRCHVSISIEYEGSDWACWCCVSISVEYVKEVTEYAQISCVSISIEYVREMTEYALLSCVSISRLCEGSDWVCSDITCIHIYRVCEGSDWAFSDVMYQCACIEKRVSKGSVI